jgi:hypothetical protein
LKSEHNRKTAKISDHVIDDDIFVGTKTIASNEKMEERRRDNKTPAVIV